jgi:PST family polysaccharide transporter
MLIFIAVSPLIAMFYKKPELQPILMVLATNFFISSFVIIQQTILTKEMEFKKLAVRDILAVIISGVIGIFLAYHGFGVWSLVYQSIAFTLINGIFLWTVSSWRPKFIFAKQDINDIFRFSANLTGFQIANYFSRNIDQLLIGKFLGPQALGYYSLAYKLMLYPLQNISWVISKVMFPAFSKIQHDLGRVRRSYLKMIRAISLFSFPLMIGLFVLAPEFVKVVYGSQWEPIIILIRIFCVCGAFQSIGSTIGNILLSQGRADLQLKLQLLGTPIVIASVFIGLNWGIVGVAACYTLQSILWVQITLYITNKLINLSLKTFYVKFFSSFVFGIVLLIVLLLFKMMISFSLFYALISSILVGLVMYFLLLILSKEIMFRENTLIIKALQ